MTANECPNFRECYSPDIRSLPLCPENYLECIEFIKALCPELYKEMMKR
jgi:hypothetical protein